MMGDPNVKLMIEASIDQAEASFREIIRTAIGEDRRGLMTFLNLMVTSTYACVGEERALTEMLRELKTNQLFLQATAGVLSLSIGKALKEILDVELE
jgi:hypothetical protein